jgi:hypothetical protein
MKNIITEELGYMKYLLGYKKGVVISEQPTKSYTQAELDAVWGKPESMKNPLLNRFAPKSAPAAAPAKTESTNKANWEDVVKYYEGNKDPNWKFDKMKKLEDDETIWDYVLVRSTDSNDDDSHMQIYDDGDVYIKNKGKGTGRSRATWEWDGTKPVIKFKDISKNASGYVQPTDTDWSAVTDDNKVIGLNAKGPLVKEVQQRLIDIGYSGTTSSSVTTDVAGCKEDVEKCDGIYGPTTKEMVKEYQKDNGLSVDGIVGQQTYNSLM